MYACGITVHKAFVLANGLFCNLLVQIVLGREVVFAVGCFKQGLFGVVAIWETLEKAFILIARRIVVTFGQQRFGIVPLKSEEP